MKVRLTEEAKLQARKERAWWRKNRDSKGLFTEQLRVARLQLENPPKLAVYGCFEGEAVRRLYLKKVHCHVYYVIHEAEQCVDIIYLCGGEIEEHPTFDETP